MDKNVSDVFAFIYHYYTVLKYFAEVMVLNAFDI